MTDRKVKPSGHLLSLLLFIFIAIYSILVSLYRPFYNWDMVMYIAAAKSFEDSNIQSLHYFTYDQLQKSVPSETYLFFIQGSDYSKTVFEDSTAFKEQLPFYQIHPLYTLLIYIFYKFGMDIGFATYFISGIVVVIAIALLYVMSLLFVDSLSIYVIPLLALIFGIPDLARYSTPDGLAFLALVISIFLYLKQRFLILLILLPFFLLIRTDFILLFIPLSLIIFAFNKELRPFTFLSILLTILTFAAIHGVFHSPGWATLFYHAFIQKLSHPISIPPILTAQNYLSVQINGLKEVLLSKNFMLNALFSIYYLLLLIKHIKSKKDKTNNFFYPTSLFLVFLCYLFIHILAFPVAPDRYFAGIYLMITFLLMGKISEDVNSVASTISKE
jgi:hypothetical protein